MDIQQILKIKETLVIGMINYLLEYNVTQYSKNDVKEIDELLDQYLYKIKTIKEINSPFYLPTVEWVVKELNKINEKTGYSIIETDQRELICEYIIKTAIYYGFLLVYKDITEEWREW